MSEILDTATGTVSGDVEQIKYAIYGREVRASIAEAIELLDQKSDEIRQSAETVASNIAEMGVFQEYIDIGSGMLVPSGKLLMHYADGTTSKTNPVSSHYPIDSTGAYIIHGTRFTVDEEGYLLPMQDGGGFYVNECGNPASGFWIDIRVSAAAEADAETFVYPQNTRRFYYDQNGKKMIPDGGWCSLGCLRYQFDSSGNAKLLGFDTADGTLLALETIKQLVERVNALEEQLASR